MTNAPSQKNRARTAATVATAAIPAVVLSSLALAEPAQAQPTESKPGHRMPSGLAAAIAGQSASKVVPAATVAGTLPSALRAAAPTTYTVAAGDTMWGIAQRHGVNLQALLKLNHLSSTSIIHPGQRIALRSAATPAKPATVAKPAAGTGNSYTIKSGDTLGAIAMRHGVKLSQLLSWNSLGMNSIIFPGQTLRLGAGAATPAPAPAKPAAPAPAKPSTPAPATGGSYVVRAGDSLGGIASRYGVSLSALASANRISNANLIFVGQRLSIPGKGSTAPAPAPAPAKPAPAKPSTPAPATGGSYVVRAGDSLGGIASRYGVSLSALASANRISNPSLIFVGQKLSIPGKGGTTLNPSSGTVTPTTPSTGLVPDSFLGYRYPAAVVSSANQNKALLNASPVPSREQMKQIITRTARDMGVEPALALAFAYQESGFDQRAVSPANAIGTMQVIPSSGQWAGQLVGRKLNLLDPYDNVTAGVAIIRSLLATSRNTEYAIAGYYQGQYSVDTHGMYADTRNYVASILAHRAVFR